MEGRQGTRGRRGGIGVAREDKVPGAGGKKHVEKGKSLGGLQ